MRRVADDALEGGAGRGVVMRQLLGVTIRASRDAAMPWPELAGHLIGVAALALEAEVLVAAVLDHVGRLRVVTERALPVDRVRELVGVGRRHTGRAVLAAAGREEKRDQTPART